MRIHLAGAETYEQAECCAASGNKYALVSHWYLSKANDFRIDRVSQALNSRNVETIIDSGVFTMMFGAGKGKSYNIESMHDYVDEYLKKVKRYDLTKFFLIECDVHKILGMKAVFELRKKFEKSKMDVIYVWHLEEGLKGIEKMADRYEYIAIGCPELRKLFKGKDASYKSAVWDLLNRIQKSSLKMPRVHLLGNTVQENMESHLAYSCDSTSWLSGVKYATAILFNGTDLMQTHLRSPLFVQTRDALVEKNPKFLEWLDENLSIEKQKTYYKNLYTTGVAYRQYGEMLDRKYQWIGDHK